MADFGIGEAATAVSIAATVASTAAAVASAQQQARAKQAELNYQAQAAKSQADAVRGAASYQAMQQQRRATLIAERATAVSAASGGSATDPRTLNITGNIAKQGSYNALMDLASGEQRARGLETQAGADTFEASQVGAALPYQQIGSVLQGASSIYSRFGMGGPSAASPDSYSDPVTTGSAADLVWQTS